jgi:hypothetical protein
MAHPHRFRTTLICNELMGDFLDLGVLFLDLDFDAANGVMRQAKQSFVSTKTLYICQYI